MDRKKALDWIHSRTKFKIKPGLERMEWMADRLDHPERKVPAIHIAGTNGKGSTTAFLRDLLVKQGYKTGTFTSPYITTFNERISINGRPIGDEDLVHWVETLKPLVEEAASLPIGEPTEFEVITMMSFLHFKEKKVDIMVIETGLGGLYDSTNIIRPLLSILTNVGLDHQDILGETYREIAEQKAGIIKEKAPVVSSVDHPDACEVVEKTASRMNAPLYQLGKEFIINSAEGHFFQYSFHHEEEYGLSMLGEHQKRNASLALTAVEIMKSKGWRMDRSLYSEALSETTWPGRLEIIGSDPLTILDGAHNYEGTLSLVHTVKKEWKEKKIYVLYGAIQGKPVHVMLDLLKEVAEEVAVVFFDFPKALTREEYKEVDASLPYYPTPSSAYMHYKDKVEKDAILLCTGSLYYISQLRKFLM